MNLPPSRLVKDCLCQDAGAVGWPVPFCRSCGKQWRFEYLTASEDTNTPTKPTADDVAPKEP